MRAFRIVISVCMLMTASCGTVEVRKLDGTKPVRIDDGFFKVAYQDNEVITETELFDALHNDAAIRDLESSYRIYAWTSAGLMAGATYFLIDGATTANDPQRALTKVGLSFGLSGLSLWAISLANGKYGKAAELYNERFTKKQGPKLKAFVTPIEDGGAVAVQSSF